MLPSTAEASADFSTSAPVITSAGSTSKATSRPESSLAMIRLLSVMMLYWGPRPPDADFLALAAGRAVDGDARQQAERVGDVVERETPELGGVDRVEHDRRIHLDRERLLEVGPQAGDEDLRDWRVGRLRRRARRGGVRRRPRAGPGRDRRCPRARRGGGPLLRARRRRIRLRAGAGRVRGGEPGELQRDEPRPRALSDPRAPRICVLI